MIPAAFDYVRASSLAQAIDLLRDDPDGTKLLAGGHTLLPALKLRLASPELLVDIGGIAELKGIEISETASRSAHWPPMPNCLLPSPCTGNYRSFARQPA